MAGNGGGDGAGSGRGGAGAGASISTAAAAIGSVESRFPLPELPRQRWGGRGGCLGGLGLSCFRSQRKAKRIVPSSTSRIPDRTTFTAAAAPPSTIQHNGVAITTPSLLAPPSSPASFTHSAVPSTAQSPSCFLSPGGASTPATTMFTTGPYAHETQLVSPPVFSTFTTEPSTAPLTPPPELAHLTTPSSPEVPYARFLSGGGYSAAAAAAGDLQATYPLYPPGSPSSSSLISPASATPRTGLSSPFPDYGGGLFCAAASAQFYLDQALQHSPAGASYSAARRSIKEEEIEAYRASFGFSADELIVTASYVEISEGVQGEPFSISPVNVIATTSSGDKEGKGGEGAATDDDSVVSTARGRRMSRSFRVPASVSDAEVDYRRSASAKDSLSIRPS